jgi:hypothetical protein
LDKEEKSNPIITQEFEKSSLNANEYETRFEASLKEGY